MPIEATQVAAASDALFTSLREYSPAEDIERMRRAFSFAHQAHDGQLRKSGEPYIMHPVRTAQILTQFRVDTDTISAALLHDVPEDTAVTLDKIEERFGKSVAYLVDGITKLSKVHYRERMEQRQIESLKKLFIHSAQDLRVILIKLADRLDNMRTIRFIANPVKRNRIARETLEVYVPIANLLGIGEIHSELEDLCFEQLDPDNYSRIKTAVEQNLEERNFILEEMIHLTEKEIKKERLEVEIMGRQKSYLSIFKKMQQKTLTNIEDIIAIRIIVPTRSDCYAMLSIIHMLFKPKTGRVKDYIAVPKPNGYRGLHTTVFGINGSIVEFQIRTRYMQLEAEYGVAAHYFYKYGTKSDATSLMQQRSSWIQKILDLQRDQPDSQEFIENLKVDVFEDRIFVFSPKGDVVDLPRRACALDFAYAIHSDIGNHCAKAEINGMQYPVTAMLSTGDTVRIITDKSSKPEREWLSFVRTTLAQNKIKEQLKREPLSKKIAVGQKLLQKEFDLLGKDYTEELSKRKLSEIAKKLPYTTIDEICIAIGEGALNPRDLLLMLFERTSLANRSSEILGRTHSERTNVNIRLVGKNKNLSFIQVIRTVASLRIPLIKFSTGTSSLLKRDHCNITVLIKDYKELSQLIESLEQIECIEGISRLFLRRTIFFIIAAFTTIIIWLSHPFIITYLALTLEQSRALQISELIIYGSLLLIIGLIFTLKKLARKNFPQLTNTGVYWFGLYLITTLALFIVLGEIITLKLPLNWVFVLGLILGIYALLTQTYLSAQNEMTHHQ